MEIAGSCFTPWCKGKQREFTSEPSVVTGMPVLTWAMCAGCVNLRN